MTLAGCITKKIQDEVRVVDNPEKDKYIDRLELEAGEGAAALLAAKDSVEGAGKKLIELTSTRLSGIHKPSQEQIDRFKKALTDNKALQSEKDKASKVDEETNILYDTVAAMDSENKSLKASIVEMKRQEAFDELRGKFLWLAGGFAMAGAGLLVVSTLIGKGRSAGIIMLLLSGASGAAPFIIQDIVTAVWFKWFVGLLIVLGASYGIWSIIDAHRHAKTCLTEPNK